jgi:D-beta-D-heptose 7-phosphate kinase/D-beta-D-heptose 1-phosphate adenosyltransferase
MTDDAAASWSGDPGTPVMIEAVRRLSRASILVVGDAMLDRYVSGQVERVSPEAPVPVLNVQRELDMPGGAGNVVRNLGALGAAVAFVSVVGDDAAGSELTGLIGGQPGVEPWLLVEGGRTTTMKTRMVAQGQQLLRVDRETSEPVHPKLAERMLRIARDAMAATSLTILSDYRKGVLAGDVPAQLIAAARQAGRPAVASLRGGDLASYAGAEVILLDGHTMPQARPPAETPTGAIPPAEVLRAQLDAGAVLILRGAEGMTVADATGIHQLPGEVGEVFDFAGACDTAAAVLAAALATGSPLPVAARLANLAAAVAMTRVGTAVVREADLLAALSPQRTALRRVVPIQAAAEQVERWRRRGWRVGLVAGRFDRLHDGHLHLLRQARAACERLVVVLASDALAARGAEAGRAVQSELERALALATQPEVDLVTISDESNLGVLLTTLRPDVLAQGNGASHGAKGRPEGLADLLRGWGGSLLVADWLDGAV